jgi:hypothetical protein
MPTIDEFLDSYVPPKDTAQVLNVANAEANPAAAASALKTARQSGLPAETIDLDPEGFARDQLRKRNAEILANNQDLSEFYASNPVAGKAVHDDLDKLDFFSKQLKAVITGWHRGVLGEKLGFVGSQMATGLGGEEEAATLEERIAGQPEFKSGVAHYVQGASAMFGQLFVDASLAGAGAGLGAVAGTVGGPVGAAAGGAAGGIAGFASAMGVAQAGRTFIETGKLRDENGAPLPLAHRRAAAGLVGVAAGALGMLGVKGNAAEIAAPIIRDATLEAMKNPGFRDALGKGAKELAKGGVTGAAMMGTLAAVQEGVIDAAKGLSDGDWKTIANDPARRQEVVSAINQSMVEGAILVGGLHAPAVSANFILDAARIHQSKSDAAALDSTLAAAKDTQTSTRSPEALAALIRQQLGDQQIGVPVEAIDKVLAAKPDALSFVPDLARQLDEARAAGTDVHLPLAEFLANAPDDVKTALRDEVRMRQDGLTPKEAKELEESPPDYGTIAFHGSPHIFDAFDMSKIGSGEGAQSYGHGLYFAEAPGVAKSYKQALAGDLFGGEQFDFTNPAHQAKATLDTHGTKEAAIEALQRHLDSLTGEFGKNIRQTLTDAIDLLKNDKPLPERIKDQGALYQVRLKLDPERTILYDRPLSEQPEFVKEKLGKLLEDTYKPINMFADNPNKPVGEVLPQDPAYAERLREAGIQGIKYLDQDSRGKKPTAEELARHDKLIADHKAIMEHAEQNKDTIQYAEEGRKYDENLLAILQKERADLERRLNQPETHNYVVLDDKLIEITHRNGEPVLKQRAVEEAARERRVNWLDPLLRPEGDKPPLGMTEAQYAAYSKKLEQLAAATERKAEALATREVAKREGAEWAKNLSEITDEVRSDLRYDPRILADTYLRDGVLGTQAVGGDARLRLDRSAVEAILGEKEQLPKGYTVARGGIHPDELASMLGYNSGQKMLTDLMEMYRIRQIEGLSPKQYFERLVSEEAARRMEQRYGRLDENIAREAQEMVVQQAQTEVLGAELEALARGGDFPLDRQSLEAATHELFANMPLERAADFQGMMRAVARMGRAAEMVLLKGDVEAAFLAKQRQWQAHIMAQGAKQLERDVAKFNKLTRRFQEKVIPSVEQSYTDRIHEVMALYDIPSKRNLAELQSAVGKELIHDWAERTSMERGVPIFVPDFMGDPTFWRGGDPAKGFLSLNELPSKAFHWIHDTLQNIQHAGKAEKQLNIAEAKIELQAAVDEGVSLLNTRNTIMQPLDPVNYDYARMIGREWDAALQRPEQLAQDLSRHDPTGIFVKVFRNLSVAKYNYDRMLREVGVELEKQPGDEKFQKSLSNLIVNEELRDWQTGKLLQLNGQDLLGIMYHFGNESNFNKLTSKFTWLGEEHGWDADAVRKLVERNATKTHWDLVQHMWNIAETYFWPKVEEMYRRVTGVAPDKITGDPFIVFDEKYSGGYAPIVKDPRWINAGQNERGIFNETQGGSSALPPKNYSVTRTEANYPVSYNFGSIISAFRQTMHDLSYREALIEANKFFNQRAIREGITDKYGMEYYKEIKPWLEYVANARLLDEATVQGVDRFMRGTRNALVTTELVGRASTIGAHSMAAAFNTFGEIGRLYGSEKVSGQVTGPMAVAYEFAKYWGSPIGWQLAGEAQGRSGELTTRMHQQDRDLRAMGERILLGEASIKDKLTFALGKPFMWLDQATAIPAYTLAERFYLKKGFSAQEASLMADTIVRNAHGATGITDMSPILRSSETYKALTVAYGTFNHTYNRMRTMAGDFAQMTEAARQKDTVEAFGKFVSGTMMAAWYIGLIGVAEHWLKHSGPDPDKEESWLAWSLKGAARQVTAALPLGRDFGQAILNKLEGKPMWTQGGPIGSMVDVTSKIVGHTVKAIDPDKEIGGTWWLDFAKGAGYAFRLPGAGQVGVTGQFLVDLQHGHQDAENPSEWMRGLLLGKSDPHRKVQRR